MNLMMITGLGAVKNLAQGQRGALYNTLEEFHKYWTQIHILCPRIKNMNLGNSKSETLNSKQYPAYASPTHKATGLQSKALAGRQNSNIESQNSEPLILFNNVYIHISPWPLFLYPIWFLKIAVLIHKQQKFNLMTVHEFPPFYNGIAARILWHFIHVPYVLEIHHIVGYPKAADIKEKIYRVITRFFIRFDSSKAKAVRVVNKFQSKDFIIKAGVPESKIQYIPSLYIDYETFKPMDLVKEYDLIFVGRLESNKGIELFIDTVKKFNCKALIVGTGSLEKQLKLQVTSYKLQVTFHGWAKDHKEIAELMNKSKVLIMPSYNEGGPRVVVEAMACGIPVLATKVGVVVDLLNEHEGGISEIKWDADDIVEKAKKYLNDQAYYQIQSREAVISAQGFDKSEQIKNYAEKIKSYANMRI